jgi:hypothetical protein
MAGRKDQMNRAVAVEALNHLLLTYRDSTMLSVQPQTIAHPMCGGWDPSWTPRAHWSDAQYVTCLACLTKDKHSIMNSLTCGTKDSNYGWSMGVYE